MSKEANVTARRVYSEPRLVEYGTLTELTRANNGSGAAEDTMMSMSALPPPQMGKVSYTVCKVGGQQQGKTTCGFS